MKTLILVSACLLGVLSSDAQTTYNGAAGGYITVAGNWSNGLPTSANPGVIGTQTVYGNSTGTGSPYTLDGYVFDLSSTLARGYDLISQFKNCSINIKSGGLLNVTNITTARATRIQGNTTITVEAGGELRTFTGNNIELQSGSVAGANPKIVIHGGKVVGGGFGVQSSVTAPAYPAMQFGAGSGQVTLSSITFDAASFAYINFLSGSGGQLTVGTQTATYYEGLWTAGRLRKDGANTGTFAENFLVTGSTLTLKPASDPVLQVASSFSFTSNGGVIIPVLPVTNTGATQNLVLSAITATGTHSSTVSEILPEPPASISPGQTQNIDFYFTPTGPGIHSFNIEVTSNDASQASPRVIPVSVEVREPIVNVPVAPSLDFGIRPANPAPSNKTITITNASNGTRALNITGTPVTGHPAFTVTSAPSSLAPGASGDVVVTFNPGTATGPMKATVQIQTDDYFGSVPTYVFQAYVEPPDTPAARLDFGSESTPVQTGYTQFVAAENGSVQVEGLTFTLKSKDGSIISRDLGVSYGDLRRDCATTPGTLNGEYLSVLIAGLKAGTLNLISFHQKAEGTGTQPENVLFGESGGTLATIAASVGRGDWVTYSTTVEAGKTYELRMLENSTNNSAYIASLLLYGNAVPGANSPYPGWASGHGLNPAWQPGDDPATDGRPEGDPDGDSFSNFKEYLFGTLPNASNGSLTQTERLGGNLLIRWKQRSGPTYRLLESSTLSAPWIQSSIPVVDDGAAADGYQPKVATVPIGDGRNFFQVEGVE